jgi:hypothetical protein
LTRRQFAQIIAASSALPALLGCAPAPSALPPAREGLKVGQRLPPVSVTDLRGSSIDTAALVARHRPFVLFFFATW